MDDRTKLDRVCISAIRTGYNDTWQIELSGVTIEFNKYEYGQGKMYLFWDNGAYEKTMVASVDLNVAIVDLEVRT